MPDRFALLKIIMATALEKFQQAMNQISPFWTKIIEITAREGEIALIKCEGFTFHTDNNSKEEEKKS